MKTPPLSAMLMIAVSALSTVAAAETAYKCGDSYSQTACPGAVLIDATDRRSAAQKAQADQVTGRDARMADAMEQARLEQEAKDLAANTPVPKKVNPVTEKKVVGKQVSKKKRKAPEYFTAQVPGEKRKPRSSKKTVLKKDPTKS